MLGYGREVEAILFVLTLVSQAAKYYTVHFKYIISFYSYRNLCEVSVVLLSSLSYETSEAQRLIAKEKARIWSRSCALLGFMAFLWILLICLYAFMF